MILKKGIFGTFAVVLSLLLLLSIYGIPVQAQGAQIPITAYRIPESAGIPNIDGSIGEAEWHVAGEWTEVQLYIDGTDTLGIMINVKFCHDGTNLYVAATYEDSAETGLDQFLVAFDMDEDGTVDRLEEWDMAIAFDTLETDWYFDTASPPADEDTDLTGANNGVDAMDWSDGQWNIEISKELSSGDGYDFDLILLDTINTQFRIIDDETTYSQSKAASAEWNVLTISDIIIPEFPFDTSLVFIVGTMLAVFVFIVIKKRKE